MIELPGFLVNGFGGHPNIEARFTEKLLDGRSELVDKLVDGGLHGCAIWVSSGLWSDLNIGKTDAIV
jgi:hypothetical protein